MIFDDSFSALDYRTDRVLRERISKDLADTTCLIVAQRIGTIKNADRLLFWMMEESSALAPTQKLMKNLRRLS